MNTVAGVVTDLMGKLLIDGAENRSSVTLEMGTAVSAADDITNDIVIGIAGLVARQSGIVEFHGMDDKIINIKISSDSDAKSAGVCVSCGGSVDLGGAVLKLTSGSTAPLAGVAAMIFNKDMVIENAKIDIYLAGYVHLERNVAGIVYETNRTVRITSP